MKPAVLRAAVILAAATASLPVFAADAPSAITPPPAALWRSLPKVALSRIPSAKSAPAALPGSQRAEGVWVVKPKWMQSRDDTAFASIVGSEVLAKELRTGQYSAHDNDVCITTSGMTSTGDDDEHASDWSSQMQSQAQINWQPPHSTDNAWLATHHPPRVTAVHFERLVQGEDGSATLEYRDAWVDPVTLGSRLIGKGALPLARVATGPTGLAVYAAREKDAVELVVRAGASPSNEPGVSQVVHNISAQLPLPFNFGQSDCGFLRTALPVDESDGAEMLTITTEAITGFTDRAPGPAGPTMRPRTARKRALLVHASATRSSADPDPVLSIALGWSGREDEFQF
jgi:hypothetical protein